MAGSADGVRAGKAFIEIGAEDKGLQGILDRVAVKFTAIGSALQSVGTIIGGFGASITAPITAVAYTLAESGAAIYEMSKRTGASVAALSALGYAAEHTGTDLATVEGAFRRMQKTIGGVKDDVEGTTGKLGNLGIAMADIRGLEPEKQFDLIAEKLARITDPTKRATAAMGVFGKSGTMLLPMIEHLAEYQKEAKALGYIRTQQSAKEMKEFSVAMLDATKAMKGLWSALGSAVVPILKQKTAAITAVVLKIRDWARAHKPLVALVYELGVGLTTLGGGIVGAGLAFVVMGTAIGGLLKPLRFVGGILGAAVMGPLRAIGFAGGVAFDLLALGARNIIPLLSKVGIATMYLLNPFKLLPLVARGVIVMFGAVAGVVTSAVTAAAGALSAMLGFTGAMVILGAAVVGVAAYFLYTSGIAGQALAGIRSIAVSVAGRVASVFSGLVSRLAKVWATVKSDAGAAFQGIRDALQAGNWSLAGQIIWTTLKLEFERGVAGIWSPLLSSFYGVKASLLNAWADTVAGLQTLWANGKMYLSSWDGMKTGAMKFVTWLTNAWSSMIDFLADKFTDFMISGDIDRRMAEVRAKMEDEGKSKGEIDAEIKRQSEFLKKGQDDYVQRMRRQRDDDRNKDYAGRQKKYDDNFKAKQPDDVKANDEARARVEADRKRAIDKNIEDLNRALAGIDPGNKARIDELRRQLESLQKQARTENYESYTKHGQGVKGRASKPGVEEAMDSFKSVGTFNKSALFGLAGGSSDTIRTRKASEKAAKHLEYLERQGRMNKGQKFA